MNDAATRTYPPLCDYILGIMLQQNITIKEVAERINIDENIIQNFLKGEIEVTIDLIIRFAKLFSESVFHLINIELSSKLQSIEEITNIQPLVHYDS